MRTWGDLKNKNPAPCKGRPGGLQTKGPRSLPQHLVPHKIQKEKDSARKTWGAFEKEAGLCNGGPGGPVKRGLKRFLGRHKDINLYPGAVGRKAHKKDWGDSGRSDLAGRPTGDIRDVAM